MQKVRLGSCSFIRTSKANDLISELIQQTNETKGMQ